VLSTELIDDTLIIEINVLFHNNKESIIEQRFATIKTDITQVRYAGGDIEHIKMNSGTVINIGVVVLRPIIYPFTFSKIKDELSHYPQEEFSFYQKVFPYLEVKNIYIPISIELYNSLNDLRSNEKGLSTSDTETYFRMLYLSLVTITTVGYGDVVPITTKTRLFVGSEAILGLVLLGLLINVISVKLKK